MTLPVDGHVHSEWSWDAVDGSMERTCARAVHLGLRAVAFTEHVDHTAWPILASDLEQHEHLRPFVDPDGTVVPPPLDLDGYLDCVQRCRDRFPDLRVLSGVELGEPHLHGAEIGRLLGSVQLDRVLGSLHCLPVDGGFSELPDLYRRLDAADVVRSYLAEIPRLMDGPAEFTVLAHIDYALRYWPARDRHLKLDLFEEEFRHALRILADTGRTLEVNTAGPLHAEIVRWWREEGGATVTFGSDAHAPEALARGFGAAVAMVEAHGFGAGRHPYDVWSRTG